uniref:zinc-ribbon domain-containing protein n=1 Tax=Lachnospira eligens TaxID=39485 RepID=UPI004025403F
MKYCENCGAELEDSAVFCDECGARVETVPQEKAVDSEQSKEAEKQENAVIDTSDKPVEKRKRMIPILCGVIGVLIIAVIVIIIVTVTSRKSNNDENNAKNDLETAVTSESADETVKSTEATTQANNWKKQYIEYLKKVDSKDYGGCEYIYMNNDDIPELMILGSNTAAGNILVTSDNTTIDSKIIASGKMYYAEKSNELDNASGHQGVYVYEIYKIIDGKIKEEEVNSFDTSGKTAFVYNRPKTIQQIIDDLSGETAKTNTETLSAASTTKKAIEGSWTSYTGNDPSMEYSSKYTLVFNSDGTVSCKGYKNNHSGNYEVESDGTIVCSFTKCIDSFPPNGPTEIQGYTAKFVLNSDGTLTSPTGSNGTTNWGKNTTWTKVQ